MSQTLAPCPRSSQRHGHPGSNIYKVKRLREWKQYREQWSPEPNEVRTTSEWRAACNTKTQNNKKKRVTPPQAGSSQPPSQRQTTKEHLSMNTSPPNPLGPRADVPR